MNLLKSFNPLEPLKAAYQLRQKLYPLAFDISKGKNSAYRLFNGISEGGSSKILKNLQIDRFGGYDLISSTEILEEQALTEIQKALIQLNSLGQIYFHRTEHRQNEMKLLTPGIPDSLQVQDPLYPKHQFLIRFKGRHCGLFLDHLDLRGFLQNLKVHKVLNLFSYTSTLSLCAQNLGQAHTTNIDLSEPALEWSQENYRINGLIPQDHSFLCIDALEYLKQAQRKKLKFDLIIIDPPSFARGKKGGTFSIQKDLLKLHALSLPLLEPNGILISSNNCSLMPMESLLDSIHLAASDLNLKCQLLRCFSQSEAFATPIEFGFNPKYRYLKGVAISVKQS